MAMHFSLHLMASTEDYTATQLFMFFMDVSTAAFLAAVCMYAVFLFNARLTSGARKCVNSAFSAAMMTSHCCSRV